MSRPIRLTSKMETVRPIGLRCEGGGLCEIHAIPRFAMRWAPSRPARLVQRSDATVEVDRPPSEAHPVCAWDSRLT